MATDVPTPKAPHSLGRRSFLGAFGALGALATLAACDRNPGGGGVSVSEPSPGQPTPPGQPAQAAKAAPLMEPADLNARLADVKAGKIAVLQVGPQILWHREHIPGSRWVGEAGTEEGLAAFQAAVKALPPDVEVVAYCGCCPVENCPNVRPARRALADRPKSSVLNLPTNFRTDWTNHGYPIEKA